MKTLIKAGVSPLAAVAVLLWAVSAYAQSSESPLAGPSGSDPEIVVTADRAIIAALRGIGAEREYSEDDVADYGSSTVGEFIDEVRGENGDDEAIFLINGEPVTDIDDLADFPAEAIKRLEILPRGSGQKIGREGDRRVYNVVLKDQIRSATLSASRRQSTAGGWGQSSGEAILSRIAGRERLNFTLRARDSGLLTESERGLVQPPPTTAFGAADFFQPVDFGAFRSLRGPSRSYDASLIGGQPLAPGVNASFSIVGRIGRDRSLSGLPRDRFLLPGTSGFSSTGTDQTLLLFGAEPLINTSQRRSLNVNTAVNAFRGSWSGGFTTQVAFNSRRFENDRQDFTRFASPILVPAGIDPFTAPVEDFLAIGTDIARSNDRTYSLKLNVGGPVIKIPAGTIRFRAAAEREGARLNSTSRRLSGDEARRHVRDATHGTFGLDIPLASRRGGFLAALGELSLSLERERIWNDLFSDLDRKSASILWQPTQRVSVTGFMGKTQELPSAELLADPLISFTNVRTFDFLTGQTVDVTVLTGGNPALRPLSRNTRRLSVNAALWPRYNLQVNADYESESLRDFISAVPAASTDVFLAFPDRFVRDASGRLVLVDSRPINFDRQSRAELRQGLSFSIPLGQTDQKAPQGDGDAALQSFKPLAAGSRARLQVTLSHSYVLRDQVVFRPGLPVVDLLDSGALGFSGGRARQLFNGSIALTDTGLGVRLTGNYRGTSSSLGGSLANPSNLTFDPIFVANLRAFADLQPLARDAAWLKDTRLTLTVENFANRRQRVTDEFGFTPLRFQGAYRDAIGRTVELELRKVF